MNRPTNQADQGNAPRLVSSLQKGLTYEEVLTIVEPISQEQLPTLRSEIRQTAERIFGNWGTLESIVKRHESTIQRRWINKSNMKRRVLLLTAWPNMAREHCPDVAVEGKSYCLRELKEEAARIMQGKPRQRKFYEGSQREALLMPYINLHDLTKPEPLLLMMNARARLPPHAFCSREIQLSTQTFGLTKWRRLAGYLMHFDGPHNVPEAYGELRQGEKSTVFSLTGTDPRVAGGKFCPGDGLWVLEIQDRIYKFLLDTVLNILHDIPAGDLSGPKYSIQPEPPLPSAKSREDGVVSLANTHLEAIYSSPGRIDFQRLQMLVTAKATEEEDKLWALREDPGRFSEDLQDFSAHRAEYVPDLFGTQHATTTMNGCRSRWGPDIRSLEFVFPISLLLSTFRNVEFWGDLAQNITELVRLQKQHFDSEKIEPGDPWPEPFAIALFEFEIILCICVERGIFILRTKAYSSPPLRPYVHRVSPDTLTNFALNSDKKPPRHISEFIKILNRLCCEDCIRSSGHIAGVQSLVERYDKFINTIPDADQAVSSYVAQEVSTLALLSECLRQIHLFQSWTTTSHKDMATPQVQAAVMARLEERRGESGDTSSLRNFRCSSRVRLMAAAIAKCSYPVHKKRTVENVEAVQKAETLLDQMWDTMMAEIEQHNVLSMHNKNVLFHQGRQLQRTPDWVEPVKPTPKTLQVACAEVLMQPFGGLDIDDKNKVQGFPVEKTKVKTRGTAAPHASTSTQAQNTDQEDQSPARIIQVNRRALKVFSTLFHTPSSTSKPGEVPWSEFLHAMRSVGFGIEKLQGSAWQFTPHRGNDGHTGACMRSILFHEPHPHSRIPFWHARMHGRRLARAYGWSGETFVAK